MKNDKYKLRKILAKLTVILAYTSYALFAHQVAAETLDEEKQRRLDRVEVSRSIKCLKLMEAIDFGLLSIYGDRPDVSPETLRLIQAFDGYCRNVLPSPTAVH